MSDDQIREVFQKSLPEAIAGPWADDARRRHRRRRAMVGGVVAAAVLGVAIPTALILSGGGSHDPQVAEPPSATPSSSPASPPPTPTGAPPAAEAICAKAQEAVGAELPGSAARLWLCGDDVGMGKRVGPAEPLTVGVDQALADFAALPAADANQVCTAEYVLSYTVVAEQADGSLRAVSGGLHGCRTVGGKQNAGAYLDSLRALWRAQREAAPPPTGDYEAAAMCGLGDALMSVTPEQATSVVACPAADAAATGLRAPADLAQRVLADIGARLASATSASAPLQGTRLLLVNPYGEPMALSRAEPGLYTDGSRVWRPSKDVDKELNALFDRLGAPPSPEPTHSGRSQWCTDAAKDTAQPLPDGRIPDGATTVRLCVDNPGLGVGDVPWAEPLDVLQDPALVERAVAEYNRRKDVSPCPEPLSASFYVVYGYGQGERHVTVKASSCLLLPEGTDPEDRGYLNAITALFTKQRALPNQMVTYRGEQGLCPAVGSLFDVDLTAEPQAIVACPRGGSALTLSPALTKELAAVLRSTKPATFTEAFGEPADSLIVVDKYGEPFKIMRDPHGMLGWVSDAGWFRVTPTGVLARELAKIFAE